MIRVGWMAADAERCLPFTRSLLSFDPASPNIKFSKVHLEHSLSTTWAEMQKAADAADISVLFWAILGHFWAILGNFWAIFGANFLWQNMHLCYLNHFLHLLVRGGVLALSPLSSATGGQAPHWPQLQYPQPFIFQHEPFNSCLKIFSEGREGKRSTLQSLL